MWWHVAAYGIDNTSCHSQSVCFVLNKLTRCIICLNCCSIGLQSAEMTGSLCRHTAAIRVHGDEGFSVPLLVCKVTRHTEVLDKWRNPALPTAVLLKQERKCERVTLAILLPGADIFFCYIKVYPRTSYIWNLIGKIAWSHGYRLSRFKPRYTLRWKNGTLYRFANGSIGIIVISR